MGFKKKMVSRPGGGGKDGKSQSGSNTARDLASDYAGKGKMSKGKRDSKSGKSC